MTTRTAFSPNVCQNAGFSSRRKKKYWDLGAVHAWRKQDEQEGARPDHCFRCGCRGLNAVLQRGLDRGGLVRHLLNVESTLYLTLYRTVGGKLPTGAGCAALFETLSHQQPGARILPCWCWANPWLCPTSFTNVVLLQTATSPAPALGLCTLCIAHPARLPGIPHFHMR